jgi:hypothetical protein
LRRLCRSSWGTYMVEDVSSCHVSDEAAKQVITSM